MKPYADSSLIVSLYLQDDHKPRGSTRMGNASSGGNNWRRNPMPIRPGSAPVFDSKTRS